MQEAVTQLAMDVEDAVRHVQAMLDYEGESGRLDAETIRALEILIKVWEDYYAAMSAVEGVS